MTFTRPREWWVSLWPSHIAEESDAAIARRVGCGRRLVTSWRSRLGIAPLPGKRSMASVVQRGTVSSTMPSPPPTPTMAGEFDGFDEDQDPITSRCVPEAETNPERAKSTRDYALPEQVVAIDALAAHGSILAAAEALNVTPWRLRSLLSEAELRAARRGWSPPHDMVNDVPLGFHVKGVSTYYDSDNKKRGQWVKTSKDAESQLVQLLDAVQAIAEPMRGMAARIAPPAYSNADTLSLYPMGDPHFGLYAWGEETGSGDFDLDEAERTLFGAVDHLVELAPPSEDALIVNLGDFFHADNASNMTARSGHVLDVDTRWAKVLRVGTRTMRRVIDRALERHQRVRVVNAIGNHDDHSSIVLSHVLDAFYCEEERVDIDMSPERYRVHEFGVNMLAIAHGDKARGANLAQMIAARWPEIWGRTKHRHAYTGHVHHDTLKEHPGITLESFRTLAARDAYHAGAGYMAGRDMKLDVWHREHGHINRHIVGVERLCA